MQQLEGGRNGSDPCRVCTGSSGDLKRETKSACNFQKRTYCWLLPVLRLHPAVGEEQAGTCRLTFLLVTAPDYKCAEPDYNTSIPRPRQQSGVSRDEVKENHKIKESGGDHEMKRK